MQLIWFEELECPNVVRFQSPGLVQQVQQATFAETLPKATPLAKRFEKLRAVICCSACYLFQGSRAKAPALYPNPADFDRLPVVVQKYIASLQPSDTVEIYSILYYSIYIYFYYINII